MALVTAFKQLIKPKARDPLRQVPPCFEPRGSKVDMVYHKERGEEIVYFRKQDEMLLQRLLHKMRAQAEQNDRQNSAEARAADAKTLKAAPRSVAVYHKTYYVISGDRFEVGRGGQGQGWCVECKSFTCTQVHEVPCRTSWA